MKHAIEAFLGAVPSRLNLAAKAALMASDGRIVRITAPAAGASMARSIGAVREAFGERWQEGDVAVLNDPDRGATHVCQLTAVAAIYRKGAIDGWAALRANAIDFGGWHPGGYSPQAVDRWAEGARFEPAKILLGGKVRREVLDLLTLNSRTPQATRRLALQLAEHTLELAKREDAAASEAVYAAELARVRQAIGALRHGGEGAADVTVPTGFAAPGCIAVRAASAGQVLKVRVDSPPVASRPVNLCRATSQDIVAAAVAASLGLADLQTGALAAALEVEVPDGMAAARLPACVGIGRETTGAALYQAASTALAAMKGERAAPRGAKRWLDEEVIGELDWTTGRLNAATVSAVLASETEVRQ